MQDMGDKDVDWLRRAIELARQARERGDHPFGALLLGPEGELLLEADNTVNTSGDRTAHAERNLMSAATKRFDAGFMRACTMVTSAEPCAMCAGAAYWAGLGRVVYGLGEKTLKDLIGPHPENLTMDLPCRTVFAAGQRPVEVRGPLIEAEAAAVHEAFWR